VAEQVSSSLRLVVMVEHYPILSETFVRNEVRALAHGGHRVRVEAQARAPTRTEPELALAGCELRYREDDAWTRRLVDLAWLTVRHPARCIADLGTRRHWRRQEWPSRLLELAPVARRVHRSGAEHIHAHFAATAALDAQRVARLLGLSHSVTAHAYDIFASPRNLVEKLNHAVVVTTGCEYNVEHLRGLVEPATRRRIHQVIMGVDCQELLRSRPLPGGRRVLAVGRLVEKKGFPHLLRAAALLERFAPLERLVILGDGPERGVLERLIWDLKLGHRVLLAGAVSHEAVRRALEEADVLAMPAVIAADGDRDSMPVVVKEALAMEVMVVASDLVGLPEMVRPPWGLLTAPGDAHALARAIEDLLARPVAARARAGSAGRAWVCEHAELHRETRRLVGLIGDARGS